MKSLVLAALMLAATAALAQVSVTVGQPGFYGRIDIGSAPPPRLIFPEPVILRPPVQVVQPVQPIYLRVPPGHAKKWDKHCQKYNACSRPVYFVQDDWYNDVYLPYYQGEHPSQGKGHGKGKSK